LIIRGAEIGSGKPKVVVPIVGGSQKEILEDTRSCMFSAPEIIEWRVDFYDKLLSIDDLQETLNLLRLIIGDIPLIFTIRTEEEGGNIHISNSKYAELLKFAAGTKQVDIIDVELFKVEKIDNIVNDLHSLGTLVILSNHDFEKTPSTNELINRLCCMQDLNADICKIAVMPRTTIDVLILLSATNEMKIKYAKKPFVTMAMGGMGSISRITGEIFGSSLTFGNAGKSSAPGQITVK
jgi:3-dehydroquinate dehydratase-1